MEISDERRGDHLIILIGGRVDGVTSPQLEQHIRDSVAQGHVKIILDCGQMGYVSSAGLRVFLVGAKICQQNKGNLRICSLQPDCDSVIRTGGFHTIIACHNTREDALAATT